MIELMKQMVARVQKGVALLDKKIPNWRTVIRQHRRSFDFHDYEHCVIGTLEHYAGQMAVLRRQLKQDGDTVKFNAAVKFLKANAVRHGFDGGKGASNTEELDILDVLWRGEIGLNQKKPKLVDPVF